MKGSQRERLDFPFLLDDKHISVITDIGYLRMDTPVMQRNQIFLRLLFPFYCLPLLEIICCEFP